MDILQSYRKINEAGIILSNTKLSMLYQDEPNLTMIKNWITNAKNLINEAELLLSEPEPAAGEKESDPGSGQVKNVSLRYCAASSDGECFHKDCPQAKEFKSSCPLPQWPDY